MLIFRIRNWCPNLCFEKFFRFASHFLYDDVSLVLSSLNSPYRTFAFDTWWDSPKETFSRWFWLLFCGMCFIYGWFFNIWVPWNGCCVHISCKWIFKIIPLVLVDLILNFLSIYLCEIHILIQRSELSQLFVIWLLFQVPFEVLNEKNMNIICFW